MDLATFVKANFWAGLIGTLVFIPFGYGYEAITVGFDSPLLKFGWLDVFMFLLVPVLMAFAFAVTALAAFPFVKYLERRGVLSLLKRNEGEVDDV